MMGTDVGLWGLEEFDNMNEQIAYNKEVRERQVAYKAFQKRLEDKFKADAARKKLCCQCDHRHEASQESDSESFSDEEQQNSWMKGNVPNGHTRHKREKHQQIKSLKAVKDVKKITKAAKR